MPDNKEIKNDNLFIIETMKDNPLKKRKFLRKTLTTAFMAIIFGMIACITIMIMQPMLYKFISPQNDPYVVLFPEDKDEMSPEEMLLESGAVENSEDETGEISENEITFTGKEDYRQLYAGMQDYIAELDRSMVTITSITADADWFNSIKESRNQSTGVILTTNGKDILIMTDASYCLGTEELIATFVDGSNVKVEIKKYDPYTGIAVLTAPMADLTEKTLEEINYVKLGSSNNSNMLGMPIVAMGNPAGRGKSVRLGMITSDKSTISLPDRNYKIIYTDINKEENATGILFSLDNNLIGVITNISAEESDDTLCAYGITELRKILEKLSNGEEMAYLGISGISVPQEVINMRGVPKGAFVSKVELGSPAAKAGIQQGDVIVKFNGRTISTFLEYTNLLYQANPGDELTLIIERKAQDEYKDLEIMLKTETMK